MHAQKALIVTPGDGSLDRLNALLAEGYRVCSATPLGGGSPDRLAALVVVEPAGQDADALLEALEDEIEEELEGDGGLAPQDPILRQIQEDLDEEG